MTPQPLVDRLMITEREAELAADTLSHLEGPEGVLAVEGTGDASHELPPELGRILQRVLSVMARGGTVTVGSVPQVLTTTSAASILGVSRPTLMKMIQDGELPAHRVGTHHRLLADDVFDARRARRERERRALRELMELEGDEV